jgi:hypothetical protein
MQMTSLTGKSFLVTVQKFEWIALHKALTDAVTVTFAGEIKAAR